MTTTTSWHRLEAEHTCYCLIAHATTPEDRKAAVRALEHARHVRDSVGIMLAMHALGRCPSAPQQP